MSLQRISTSEQIANELRAQIESGELEPGDTLPSDTALARRFDVSKPTVTKARAMLVALGLVSSRAGAASTVRQVDRAPAPARDPPQRPRTAGRVYPEGHYARILRAGIAPASSEVAEALGTEPGSPVIERRQVIHAADERPLATSRTYFPAILLDQCPALLKTEQIPQGATRYVEQQTGRAVAWTAAAVSCRRGGPQRDGDAAQLRLAPDACLLVLATTTYDVNAATIAHEIELHPPDTSIPLDVFRC